MEVHRDTKRHPASLKVQDIAPWLAIMLNAGGDPDEPPDKDAIDALRAMALAGRD